MPFDRRPGRFPAFYLYHMNAWLSRPPAIFSVIQTVSFQLVRRRYPFSECGGKTPLSEGAERPNANARPNTLFLAPRGSKAASCCRTPKARRSGQAGEGQTLCYGQRADFLSNAVSAAFVDVAGTADKKTGLTEAGYRETRNRKIRCHDTDCARRADACHGVAVHRPCEAKGGRVISPCHRGRRESRVRAFWRGLRRRTRTCRFPNRA